MSDWHWDSNIEYWLRHVQKQCAIEVNRVLEAEFGLSERYWPVLQTLFVEQGIQQTTICERTGEPGYQTSRVIDRLESLGLVERRSDPMNHRARLVYLTDSGEALRAPLEERMKTLHDRWLNSASVNTSDVKDMLSKWLPVQTD